MRLLWRRAYSGGAACGLPTESPALRQKLSGPGRTGAWSAAGKLRYPAAVGAARSCRAAAARGEARRRRDGPPGQAFEGKRPVRPVNRATLEEDLRKAEAGATAQVGSADALEPALREALAHPGPALVDVAVDPNEPPMPGKVADDRTILVEGPKFVLERLAEM